MSPELVAVKGGDKHIHVSKFQIAEVTDAGEGSEGRFSGYAAIFDELIPSYNEIVDKGAFTQTLRHNRGQVPVLWMHGSWIDPPMPIGLGQRAEEDDYGLFVEAKLDLQNNQAAREAWGFMRLANEVNRKIGLSIGFNPIQLLVTDGDEPSHVKELRLWEYSPTPPDWQAAPNAGIDEMRSSYRSEMYRVVAELLREMGVNNSALEAAAATQGATTELTEAQLHSVAESLDGLLTKL